LLAVRDTARAVEALESSVNVVETVRANAASHEERVRFLETRRAVYEELAGVHFQLGDPERAFELLEHSRSRALLDSLQGGVSLAANENGALEVLLDEAAEPEPMSRLSASLEPGTLVLHYTVTRDWFAILAIDSKGLRAWRVRDLAEDELSRLALLFGGDATASFALQEGWTQLYSDAQRSLSLLLLAPVAHLLPDASTLIIVPDDVLFSLPWGALRWGDWTRYLSETHAIAVQPSASVYVRLRGRPSRGAARERALVVANPSFDSRGASLPFLPEAEVEARELGRLMPGSRVLLGPEANETAVRRAMGEFPVVHFATHGRVDTERPGQSSLLLAGEKGILEESALSPLSPEDGVLSGLEVLETSLQPGALITLAACETVRGPQRRGEGVVGLARAFLQSGAGTVVATLWPVEDRATRELMVRFYEELGSGRSAAAALSRAQAGIAQGRAGETRRYPYFWAGFVLIGDDR
jgi:CHAT domain-containing protein